MNSNYEEIDLCEELIPELSQTIIVPVIGDSMIGIGIYPENWLIVENENHQPIKHSEGSICISGIVRSVIRRNLSKL